MSDPVGPFPSQGAPSQPVNQLLRRAVRLPAELVEMARLLAARRRRDRMLAERYRRFEAESAQSPPRRTFAELFHTDPAGELAVPACSIHPDPWELPAHERCVLAAIVRAMRPSQIFEFGTYLGASTLLLAMNAPVDATIHTLELPQEERESYYMRSFGTTLGWTFEAGRTFKDSSHAKRIRQHLGTSGAFDFAPFTAAVDVVFVDGDHRYEQVWSDTRAALRMVRPGGVIAWDDYTPGSLGVVRCLNELGKQVTLARIRGTRLVVHRAPSREKPV